MSSTVNGSNGTAKFKAKSKSSWNVEFDEMTWDMPEGWVAAGGNGEISWVWGKFMRSGRLYSYTGSYLPDKDREWNVQRGEIYFILY